MSLTAIPSGSEARIVLARIDVDGFVEAEGRGLPGERLHLAATLPDP